MTTIDFTSEQLARIAMRKVRRASLNAAISLEEMSKQAWSKSKGKKKKK
jgi:hypothetical protein